MEINRYLTNLLTHELMVHDQLSDLFVKQLNREKERDKQCVKNPRQEPGAHDDSSW